MSQKKKVVKPIQIALTEDQIARIIQEAAKSRRSLNVESLEDRIAPSRFGLPVFGGGEVDGGSVGGPMLQDPGDPFTTSSDGTLASPTGPTPPQGPHGGNFGPIQPPIQPPVGGGDPLSGGDPTLVGGPTGPIDPSAPPGVPGPGMDGGSGPNGPMLYGPNGPIDPLQIPPALTNLDPNAPGFMPRFDSFMEQQLTQLEMERGEPLSEDEINEHRSNILRQLRGWNN